MFDVGDLDYRMQLAEVRNAYARLLAEHPGGLGKYQTKEEMIEFIASKYALGPYSINPESLEERMAVERIRRLFPPYLTRRSRFKAMSEERVKRMNRERRFKKIALFGTIAIVIVGAIVGASVGITKAVQANETASQVVFVEEEFVMGECTKESEGNYTVTFSGLVRNNTKESVIATITALTYYNNSWRELVSADKELNYNTGVLLPGKRTTYLCVGSIPRQLIDYRMRVVWQKT